mmetsp:Transcript_116258/g.335829  ORF Transcript_116258/g.335829 Transcript_116258/m.335829 type:complete len:419 (-) Transcript_116258:566-1822(-)
MSFVNWLDKSNSSLAFASRLASFNSSTFFSAATTSGRFSHGSRFARSSSSCFWRRFRFSSASASAFRFASRFRSNSSSALFRSSSPASSSLRFASAASSSFRFFSSISSAKVFDNVACTSDSSRHVFAVFSQVFFAASFTIFVAALISSSERPKDLARPRSSVVRSKAANSGCHACTKSTGVVAEASRATSRQKSTTSGSPAVRLTGAATPAMLAVTPSFPATRMPMFALLVHASSCCFLPALTTAILVSPKPLEEMSLIVISALQVFSMPLPSLHPEPSFVRLTREALFSTAAASFMKALMAPEDSSSLATADRLAGTVASMGNARTYMREPALPLPLLVSRRNFLSFSDGSTAAMRLSSPSRALSTTSAKANSPLRPGTWGSSMGKYWPVLPLPGTSSKSNSTGGACPCPPALICL